MLPGKRHQPAERISGCQSSALEKLSLVQSLGKNLRAESSCGVSGAMDYLALYTLGHLGHLPSLRPSFAFLNGSPRKQVPQVWSTSAPQQLSLYKGGHFQFLSKLIATKARVRELHLLSVLIGGRAGGGDLQKFAQTTTVTCQRRLPHHLSRELGLTTVSRL